MILTVFAIYMYVHLLTLDLHKFGYVPNLHKLSKRWPCRLSDLIRDWQKVFLGFQPCI